MPEDSYDYVSAIIAYEQDELPYEQELELFQYLLNTGIINQLQGHYGRHAQVLLETGEIKSQ